MSKTISPIKVLIGLVATAGLVACATQARDEDHGRHHTDSSSASPAEGGMGGSAMTGSQAGCGMMGAGMAGSQGGCAMMGDSKAAGGMQHMDKKSMCAMYRNMRDAPTDQARQEMMDRQMQGVSPEMRQQHMDMMRQQCE